MSTNARVTITGLGLLSPIGSQPSAVLAALRAGSGGIGPVTRYPSDHLNSRVAGEVPDLACFVESRDRIEQMATAAARQAWISADIPANKFSRDRIGLCVGASGAGLSHHSTDDVFSLQFQPYQQATAIACELGITGPVVMFTSASAGSGLALVHAMNLLRAGACDLVIAGGAECLSQVNHESMDGMRLCGVTACSPFSGEPGLTVGEGSAFFVLERMDDAIARNAPVRVELFSYGVTQDAYDVVAGDPSGEGLARAFVASLDSASVMPFDVDWIKANGTSNRDQDVAETLAVKQVFPTAPPVTAVESFIGHANGAAPALGLALAIIAFENAWLPPTLNFLSYRPGCDLDYVPNQGRPANANCVLASSLGFGGSNVALLFGIPRPAACKTNAKHDLCITGVGIVSPFGLGFQCFINGLRQGLSAIRTDSTGLSAGFAGTLRQQRASVRVTLLQRFAIAAAEEALHSARLAYSHFDPNRLGVFVGLCRGSADARTRYAASLLDRHSRKTMGKVVVRMGRFTVASALSQRFKIKGYGGTISEGFGAGLHALASACIHLENSSAEDALLVVAADETGAGPASSLGDMKWLAPGHDGSFLRPYDPHSPGSTLAEGAVALIVERTRVARNRGASILAHIQGVGLSAGQNPETLATAILRSIAQANTTSDEISAAYGNGSGIWQHDETEIKVLRQVLPAGTPIGCVNSALGFAESASGLFHAAAALHGFSNDEFFPISDVHPAAPLRGCFPRQLLTARTEGHRNASVLLGQ